MKNRLKSDNYRKETIYLKIAEGFGGNFVVNFCQVLTHITLSPTNAVLNCQS